MFRLEFEVSGSQKIECVEVMIELCMNPWRGRTSRTLHTFPLLLPDTVDFANIRQPRRNVVIMIDSKTFELIH